jgi:protein TonB
MSQFSVNRLKYDRSFYLLCGLSLSLLAILTAFRWSSPKPIHHTLADHYSSEDPFQFVDISPDVEIEKEQIKRPKPNPQKITTVSDPTPDPAQEPVPDPEPLPDPGPVPGTTSPPAELIVEDDLPFRIVEEMPVYPGGEKALFEDISRNFKIPEIDRRAGLEGVIHLSFVVNTAGEVVNVEVLRGISPATDAEAVKAIQKLKRYTPGKQRGRAVSVIYTIPIRVSLR